MARVGCQKVKGLLSHFLSIFSHFEISEPLFFQKYSVKMEDDDVMAVTESEEDLHPAFLGIKSLFLSIFSDFAAEGGNFFVFLAIFRDFLKRIRRRRRIFLAISKNL